jgi:class 3 adenylate cyclase/tetratricopeptide (TPR) repeat protein
MRCSSCGTENRAGRKFCVQCGAPLSRSCPSCGAPAETDERFCGECGAALDQAAAAAPEEERRLVTVLFSDIAGFTSMSEGMDPEAVKALAARCAALMGEEVTRFGGTVTSVMGDAVMALFGAPVAHEDDAERAVRAGMAMLERIRSFTEAPRPLQLHVGINTGETMAGVVGPDERRDYTAMGDTTNTAARLMNAAPAGSVFVGEKTHASTRHAVSFEEVEPITAKGKAEPVPAWRVVEVSAVPAARPMGTAPLVGREEELSALRRVWDRVRAERSPGSAVVIGLPGMGKSRLLTEFTTTLPDPCPVHRGRCLSYGEGITYWPIAEIVKDAAGILNDDSPNDLSAKLDSFLRALPTDDADELRTMATGVATLVGAPTTPEGSYRAAEITQAELHWGIRRILELMAADGPVVLLLEDLHWAEPTLLELLDYVLGTAVAPVMILATARPEVTDSWPSVLTQNGRRQVIRLEGLSDRQSEELLATLLQGSSPDSGPAARLLRIAAGNPLFLEETVQMLTDAGVIDPSGRLTKGADEALPVPGNLQALIGSRLDLLPSGDRQIAQLASVVGLTFWVGAVEHLRGQGDGVAGGLQRLERRDIVHAQAASSVAGEREYAFKHILIRDVAYGRLPKRRRSELHLLFSEWVGALPASEEEFIEIVAYHLEQACLLARELGHAAEDAPVAQAVDALTRAGVKAERRGGTREADRFFARALDLAGPDRPGTVAQLQLHRGRTLVQLGELREGGSRLRDVVEQAPGVGRPDLLGEALVRLANIDWKQGRAVEAGTRLDEALGIAADIGDRSLQVRAAFERSSVRAYLLGDTKEALEDLGRARGVAEALDDRSLRAELHLRTGTLLYNLGRLARAEEEFERCLSLARETGSLRDEVRATQSLVFVTYYRGNAAEAERLGLQAAEWLERTGDTLLRIQNFLELAKLALDRGDAVVAEERLRLALDLATSSDAHWLVVDVNRWLTEALLLQDRLAEASQTAQAALAGLPEEDDYARAAAFLAAGSVATARGNPDVAVGRFERALVLMEEQQLVTDLAEARIAFARVLRRFGQVDRARRELRAAHDGLRDTDALGLIGLIDAELEATEGARA